jgi:microcystin-dependent protein
VTLTVSQIPEHSHGLQAKAAKTPTQRKSEPSDAAWLGLSGPTGRVYNPAATTFDAPFSNKAVGYSGGSAPHQNMQPVLALNFCISLSGIFPSRN